MCIVYAVDKYGISIADVTTGDFFVTEVDSERKLLDELNKSNKLKKGDIIVMSAFGGGLTSGACVIEW